MPHARQTSSSSSHPAELLRPRDGEPPRGDPGGRPPGSAPRVLPLFVDRPRLRAWSSLVASSRSRSKGSLIPGLLHKAMRDVHIRHEVEPYVGFVPSLFLCAVGNGARDPVRRNLPLAPEHRTTCSSPPRSRPPRRLPRPDDAAQGDLAGRRLPDPRERHLHLRALLLIEAMPSCRGRRAPRPLRRHLRHGDRHQPHPAGVLVARHGPALGAEGVKR